MTEGWVDCPPLGPGWLRREVLRRNATRPGQSDTYYMSPRGEKIRSRVELSRLLGCSRDLTDFDFRKGVFVDPGSKPELPPLPPAGRSPQKIKKGRKKHHSPGAAVPPLPKKPPYTQVLEEPLDQKPLELKLELPKEALTTISPQTQKPLVLLETQPTVESQSMETTQPTAKVQPMETIHPIVEALPMEITQPTVEAQSMETTQPTIEAQPMETTQPTVEVQSKETIQPTVESQPMERTQPFKRRKRKHNTSIPTPGKMGDVTVQDTISEETIVCASCQGHFPGVMLPSQRRCRWLCPDCRAQRRDFNREQRYYKRIGCGACQACQMSQDCGICRVCVLRAQSPELRIGIKCLLRRCLKIVKKGLECGMCQACKITEDCGSCRICLRRQKPGLKRQWKCLKRRCLKSKKKILPKKDGGTSKKLTDEAVPAKDAFTPVRRRKKQPASVTDGPSPKAQGVQKRRHKRLSAPPSSPPPASTDGPLPKAQLTSDYCRRQKRSATTKQQMGVVKEKRKVGRPPKHSTASACTSTSRRNRKCGECEACLLKMDCGRCDFCCDKPKFGGRNLKHQKCRWRQCLHFAMKRLLPEEWSSPEAEGAAAAGWKVRRRRRRRNAFGGHSCKPDRIKQVGQQGAKGSGQEQLAKASFQLEVEESPLSCELLDLSKAKNPEMPEPEQQLKKQPETVDPVYKQPVKKQPILPLHIREESEVPRHPSPPTHVKVSAGLPQVKRAWGIQGKEVVVLDDEDDDEEEQLEQIRPPVIMEIYSLHDVQPLSQLDSVLEEFLAELNEIPLPAHWEVLPPLGGPNLRLVQRSKHSTMSAAVIHIRPGLFFHVVVQDLPVPLEHKLYTRHPARLTTVDEVVELICDLEAYRLCPGWPAGWHAGERSQACDVLVYSGCCPKCRLNPWPSGSGTR